MLQKSFIMFPPQGPGFAVYGIGPGANKCSYRGQSLMEFLKTLWGKLWKIKARLNKQWDKLDKINLDNPKNKSIIDEFLRVGTWAYALCLELQPFEADCRYGPTYPLREMYIKKLEEICIQ